MRPFESLLPCVMFLKMPFAVSLAASEALTQSLYDDN